MLREVVVAGDSSYCVKIGAGARETLPSLLPQNASRVAVLYSASLHAFAQPIAKALNAFEIALPEAEAAKDIATLEYCWRKLGELGFTRNDVLVSVGGGATTDVVGFVAATWLRGISVIHVPTSLLAMVDAAIGGKTGINTEAGKNLVGAFHNPVAVVCDLEYLKNLPEAELRQGLAEVIKCGLIADPEILKILQPLTLHDLDIESEALINLVTRAVSVKAKVVAADFRESSQSGVGREALNYGHTLGHAIERRERYQWRHGNAIAVGMAFVAEVSLRLGMLDESGRDLHISTLKQFKLPTSYEPAAWAELRSAMDLDKKTRGSELRLVLLESLQKPVVVVSPSEEILQSSFQALGGL